MAERCFGCAEALRIAALAREIARVEVAVIAIETAQAPVPERVVAVPAYLVDGKLVSLGNPRRDAFLAGLRHRVEELAP